ncbi:hypothetical protein AeNC1_011753 [Aphanomyces euteiches]|nr:hypothetical protein AeNC1_011753 [Aphanomyces euteiches]
MKTSKSCIEDHEVSQTTVSNWYKFCRQMCHEEMGACTAKIGGVVPIVEIDETSDRWLFGRVDRATKKWFGVLTFSDRTRARLVIDNHIREATLIVSDKFSAYLSANERNTLANNLALARMGNSHMWLNHSSNFVNPMNGAHTQSIERNTLANNPALARMG